MKISDLTDEELEGLSTATLSNMAWGAGYSGTDEDARRVGRILRKRCNRFPVLDHGRAWDLKYDPDDDCDERGILPGEF